MASELRNKQEQPETDRINSETQGGARKERSGEDERQGRAEGVERLAKRRYLKAQTEFDRWSIGTIVILC